jgi:hypothetical protein
MPHLEEPEPDVFEQELPATGVPVPDGEEPEESEEGGMPGLLDGLLGGSR